MSFRRVTQREVAEKAGVHISTVSLSLNNHPRIPEETKKRVQKIAKELGYAPDPMLSALAAYRDQRRDVTFQGTLAWLTNSQDGSDWKMGTHYYNYFQGAKARATELGYQLEVFDVDGKNLTTKRIPSILRARNVAGVLVCPQPHGYANFSFPWKDFSLVTFGYSMREPRLHTVSSAHYRNTRLAMREAFQRGYKRPGLLIEKVTDMNCDRNLSAAFLMETYLRGDRDRIPPVFHPLRDKVDPDLSLTDGVVEWIQQNEIDIILLPQSSVPLLERAGVRYPDDVSLISLTLPNSDGEIAGIVEDDLMIGRIAIDKLIAMIHRGERGIPEHPLKTHLEGVWHDGASCPTKDIVTNTVEVAGSV